MFLTSCSSSGFRVLLHIWNETLQCTLSDLEDCILYINLSTFTEALEVGRECMAGMAVSLALSHSTAAFLLQPEYVSPYFSLQFDIHNIKLAMY